MALHGLNIDGFSLFIVIIISFLADIGILYHSELYLQILQEIFKNILCIYLFTILLCFYRSCDS